MELYSRTVRGKRVWYVVAHYWDNGVRKRARRTTGVRDDGTAKARRTAEINARDIEQSLALGRNRVARPTTITQAVDALIEKMELANRSQATIDIVLEKAANLFAFFGPTKPISQVTEDGFSDFVKERRAAKAQPGTIERELRTLCQAARAVKVTPPAMPDLGRVYTPRERFLSHAEMLRLVAAVHPKRKDHVVMYRLTGIRRSELYRITKADCDFVRNEVRVRGTKTEGADRIIPMAPEVRDILLERSKRQPMFEPWGERNALRDLNLAASKAGVDQLNFNDLRRSFATELAAKGAPILHVAKLLGHSSTRMVEHVYARVGQGQHMHDAIGLLSGLRKRETKRVRKRA